MLLDRIRALFKPQLYHGWNKKKSYFEGWYYKLIDQKEEKAFAIIPGIAMDENGNKHAFIQVLNANEQRSRYYKFEMEQFHADKKEFKIQIENNFFSEDRLHLELEDHQADLQFTGQVVWPSSFLSPGVMGPYSFVPFMECYHGILSVHHKILGSLFEKGKEHNFDQGIGYMEKDWGRSFPSAYVWMQSNHFGKEKISFKASVAKIPWLRSSFVGFIAGLYIEGEFIQFTTYNNTRLQKLEINENWVHLEMSNKKFQIKVDAERMDSTELASPINGFMDGRINESMNSILNIELTELKSAKVTKLQGRNAGLEVAGKIEEIIT